MRSRARDDGLAATRLVIESLAGESPEVRFATTGIQQLTFGGRPPIGELLVAITDERILTWRTFDVRAGDVEPFSDFLHELDSRPSALAYLTDLNQIVVGTRQGDLRVFSAFTDTAFSSSVDIPGRAAGMQVRSIVIAEDGTGWVGMGGFSPDPRAGLIAAVALRSGLRRAELVQPVDAIGISGPVVVLDRVRRVVYSNAVLDVGDRSSVDVFRTPVFRSP